LQKPNARGRDIQTATELSAVCYVVTNTFFGSGGLKFENDTETTHMRCLASATDDLVGAACPTTRILTVPRSICREGDLWFNDVHGNLVCRSRQNAPPAPQYNVSGYGCCGAFPCTRFQILQMHFEWAAGANLHGTAFSPPRIRTGQETYCFSRGQFTRRQNPRLSNRGARGSSWWPPQPLR
jgi:hypothetical protein